MTQEFHFGVPIPKTFTKFNVLITSYEILMLEFKSLNKMKWKTIVIDEGQKLKNEKSKIFNN
jgi:SNF2 family DNA or RNA helicase